MVQGIDNVGTFKMYNFTLYEYSNTPYLKYGSL